MALRKKTLKVQIRGHPSADRRQLAAVQYGLAQRSSISSLDEAATKVLPLRRSSLSHANNRKTRGDRLCLLPYRPTLAVAHQCRNRYRRPHFHLPQNHLNRRRRHLPQRGRRQRQRLPPRRGPSPPISKLHPNSLWQRATRAANQNQIHRLRPCHKLIAQQLTRRNGAPPSMVVVLVRTRSLRHLPCLKASRQRSASGRVSYLRSGDKEVDAKHCTTIHMYLSF